MGGAAVRVRGIDLAVQESGEGLPFFWGHGLLCSTAQEDDAGLFDWSDLSQDLRLIRYDARGHGRSEATLAPEGYRWPELAADLLALADGLAVERAVLGGVSMGCATALHAACVAPERTLGLVLVAPPTAWRTRPRQARIYRFSAALVRKFGVDPFRWMGQLAGLAAGDPVLAAMQRSVLDHLRRADRRAVVAALLGAAGSDLPDEDALRALEVPALILAWRDDPTHPVSSAERLADLLPEAELRVADSGDDIRGWSAEIRGFLASRVVSRVPAPSPPPAPAPGAPGEGAP